MTNPPKLLLLQVQGPNNHWLYKDGPHWPFFLHIYAEQFTAQIMHIFSYVQTGLYNTWLQSLQSAFLRCSALFGGRQALMEFTPEISSPFESVSLYYSSAGVTEPLNETLHGDTQTDKLPKELKCTSPNWATQVFLHVQCILWCKVVNVRIHLVLRYCSRGR